MCKCHSLAISCLWLTLSPLTGRAAPSADPTLVPHAAAAANPMLATHAPPSVDPVLMAHAPRDARQNMTAALSEAVRTGDEPKVAALLNAGVDANGDAKSATPPLLWAAIMDRPSIAEQLLAHGADVNRAIPSGHWAGLTPLIAAANGRGNIYSGAVEPPAPPQTFGKDPTQLRRRNAAVRAWRMRVAVWRSGYFELVKLMVAHGANINAQLTLGTTAVDSAATDGDTRTVRFLISEGARLDLPSHEADILGQPHEATNGYYALVGAIYEDKHNPELVALLLAHGASPNSTSPSEMTPLGAAASSGDAGVVRMILRYGAHPGDLDYYGRTALSYARTHPEVAALLRNATLKEAKPGR